MTIRKADMEYEEQQDSARESPNNIPDTNQTRRWSSSHKPIWILREYMSSLPCIHAPMKLCMRETRPSWHGWSYLFCRPTVRHKVLLPGNESKRQQQGQGGSAKRNIRTFRVMSLGRKRVKQIPTSIKLLNLVWAMRRKWGITTAEV